MYSMNISLDLKKKKKITISLKSLLTSTLTWCIWSSMCTWNIKPKLIINMSDVNFHHWYWVKMVVLTFTVLQWGLSALRQILNWEGYFSNYFLCIMGQSCDLFSEMDHGQQLYSSFQEWLLKQQIHIIHYFLFLQVIADSINDLVGWRIHRMGGTWNSESLCGRKSFAICRWNINISNE